MSGSQEKFQIYLSKMDAFQEIAVRNGVALKELLVKKAGVDEELAAALIKEWERKKGVTTGTAPVGSGIFKELFASYLNAMGSFQKLADLQGVPLRDWLIEKCGIDAESADALMQEWGPQAPQKSPSLLAFARESESPAAASDAERPESSENISAQAAAPHAAASEKVQGRKKAGENSENDVVITISGTAAGAEAAAAPRIEQSDLESQIDKLHNLADLSGHKEPIQLIAELKSFSYKKNYLVHSVSAEEKSNADRLIRFRDEQDKKLSRFEKNLAETKEELSSLREKPPKLFGKGEHRQKIQDAEAAITRMDNEIAVIKTKKAEKQAAYSAAVALIEKYAAGKREIDSQYALDESKFNEAKDVIIRALYWALLDIPEEILIGSVIEHIEWYKSFFKALPKKIDFPVQGWLKAYTIASKLTSDYPVWRSEIDNIHFVIENEMKSLKDLIRKFLGEFVDNLKELFQAVCQLCVSRSEAEKTQGDTVLELADHLENELTKSFDPSIIEFCSHVLPSFYIIHGLAELLNFELNMEHFFENLEHVDRLSSQYKTTREAQMKRFSELSEASDRMLIVCFKGAEEALAIADQADIPDGIAPCKAIILADFENYFKTSEDTLKRILH